MARFRKKSSRRRFSFGRRSRSRSRSSGGIGTSFLLASAAYGAVREKVSNMLTPLTSKIPLGNIADEAVLGAAGYLAMKKGNGIVRELGRAALTIEAARIGETIANGQLSMGGVQSTSSGYNFG